MRKQVWITLAVFVVMALGLVVWQICRLREPVYEGKTFTAWMEDLDGRHPGPEYDRAREAVRHIGRAAVPQLISVLRDRDASPKHKLVKWAFEHHLTKSKPVPVKEKQHRAVLACNVLGPDASAAIPALIALLNDGFTESFVGAALGRIGPEATVPLIGALTNRNALVRAEVMIALANFPTNGTTVVPVLIQCLKDNAGFVRALAARSLGELTQEPTISIPALAGVLEDGDVQVRRNACVALGKFKKQAKGATRHLFGALEDPDHSIQVVAAIALARIEPDNKSTVERTMPFLIEALEGLRGKDLKYPLGFRYSAIETLEECGRLALPAVPALLGCLEAPEPYIRQSASKALKAIDPESAAKVVR
ncbi:MAG TPA: HEAT repeat domain-containing protein [Patescibacteria group bacterium]|nr:HEAT repeat domain-containing protein [Patescibacteria group bacterium]